MLNHINFRMLALVGVTLLLTVSITYCFADNANIVISKNNSSLDIIVSPDSRRSIDVNKQSSLSVDVKKLDKPSKIISIDKKSVLTSKADGKYNRRKPVNVNKSSSLTAGKFKEK